MLVFLLTMALSGAAYWQLARRQPRRPIAVPLPLPASPVDRIEAVRRIVKHLIRRRVSELVEGEAAVLVGIVRGVPDAAMLVSPLTGTRCVGYHVTVRTADVWSLPVFDGAQCASFELADASGAIRVNAAGLELAVTRAVTRQFTSIAELPWLPPSARRRGVGVVEIHEGVLLLDARVLVCGVPTRTLAPTDYRDGAVTIELVATPTFPLVASTDQDLFRQGKRPIDPAELP